MIAVLSGLWTAVRGWFAGLPWTVIGAAAIAGLAGGLGLAVYRAGESAARAETMRALAADNAKTAARYQNEAELAEKAAAEDRARADALALENTQLKEKVDAVAQGAASPGVDLAVRGLQSPRFKARVSRMPGAGR